MMISSATLASIFSSNSKLTRSFGVRMMISSSSALGMTNPSAKLAQSKDMKIDVKRMMDDLNDGWSKMPEIFII